MLPDVNLASYTYSDDIKRLFIVAEGFEPRSYFWIGHEQNSTKFEDVIVVKYNPGKKSRFVEMMDCVKKHALNTPKIMEYNRFEPTVFEQQIKSFFINNRDYYEEIIIDISVMSKLLIMIILSSLRNYQGGLRLLYSEPYNWGPTQKKYSDIIEKKTFGTCIGLSSVGVGNVVRTPLLSSIVMQDCPILLVAFLSFNEQLINVLINEISPTQLRLINHKCSRIKWRENAMFSIHKNLIEEYHVNEVESFDLLDYKSVFEYLATTYRDNCYDYRIVLSPTGCKLHTVACALLKLCCSDVHIEYPTPESYLFEEYSSDKVYSVYEICFPEFCDTINTLAKEYSLNG